MKPPRSRRDDLLTTKLDDEVVIYDPETKQAHSLNRLAVAVWTHSEGAKTVEDLQQRVSGDLGVLIDEASVLSALRKLQKAHLLLDKVSAAGPITRREALTRGGKLGVAAMVTPLVASALVPAAAAAASSVCAAGTTCANLVFCGVGGATCGCFATTEGDPTCTGDRSCFGIQACTASSQCTNPGERCVVNTCCGAAGVCGPACPSGAAPTASFHGQGTVTFQP